MSKRMVGKELQEKMIFLVLSLWVSVPKNELFVFIHGSVEVLLLPAGSQPGEVAKTPANSTLRTTSCSFSSMAVLSFLSFQLALSQVR
jgi:hypothetical protein